MKSTIFSLLPIAGLAIAAESVCTQQTVTTTAYETVYETAKAADVTSKNVADLTSASCSSRSTITKTVTPTVTVTPGAATPESVQETTTTSTLNIYTTVVVHPSGGYWGNVSTSTQLAHDASSQAAAYPTMSVLPTTQVAYSVAYTPIPQSEAAKSYAAAASSNAAVMPSSQYEAPAASSPAAAAPSAYPVTKKATTAATSANTKSGQATFYGGNVSGGMCSFTGYTIPAGIYGTALSDANWDTAANCGSCVSVTGPSGTKITAMIVDQCPGCGTNHLDLFPDAFAKLAAPSKGEIDVKWDIVPCGITSPIVLKNKEGTSKFWFSMQVMNSNVPVAKLEVSTDGGKTWKATTRKDYNFFENPAGFGADSVDVKVTATSGSAIVVKSVSIAPKSTKTGPSNFA
jgi:expansin (peptidoglycan-binding protein)